MSRETSKNPGLIKLMVVEIYLPILRAGLAGEEHIEGVSGGRLFLSKKSSLSISALASRSGSDFSKDSSYQTDKKQKNI